MILTILFIILAAICKAFVDTIAFHQGGIFHDLKFFDINKQGKMLPFTKWPVDGFHVFNSLMIVFFILAICFRPDVEWYFLIPGAGLLFNVTFNIFFNKFLN